MTRRARAEDIDTICKGLPEVELGTSRGDLPTCEVRGKGFPLLRAPHHTAVDPASGEMYDDLVVIGVPTDADRRALVEDELAEIITEARATMAPAPLARKFFGDV